MHVITGLDTGGAETQLALLAEARKAAGAEDMVVSMIPGGALRARLDGLAPAECPFAEPPAETNATGAGVTYVRPELVVEVEFAQWTGEDHLRAPVFMRVRED